MLLKYPEGRNGAGDAHHYEQDPEKDEDPGVAAGYLHEGKIEGQKYKR